MVAYGGWHCWLSAGNPGKTVRVLDVARVRADLPAAAAVLTLTLPAHPEEISCDILVVGASTGGVAAALAAARGGHSVCVAEETTWIGGQMTAQGVSALDENKYIETTAGTASYRKLRDGIRQYYAQRYDLSMRGPGEKFFNPGGCWVSALCFEPEAALEVLGSMLQPYVGARHGVPLLRIFLRTKTVSAEARGNRISSVLTYGFESRRWIAFRPRYVLDATDLGELLPLVGAEDVTGAEPRSLTGEPHARDDAGDPNDNQSFTYTFVLRRDPDHAHVLAKPPEYETRRGDQPYTLTVDYGKGKSLTYRMFEKAAQTPGAFWTYRRLIAAENFISPKAPVAAGGVYPQGWNRRSGAQRAPLQVPSEVSMINWPGNDYCGPGLLSSDPEQQAQALREGKATSLGFAHWLQTEVPRDDGGKGYPEMELLTSELGSSDGLSQYPYVRESRRIRALKTIQEQEISALYQKGARAELFPDSVGIGLYPIDIHSCSKQDFTTPSKPFQIPVGALVPQRLENLLAASKDIGTTHITNGAYRLHPVEWAIGEAAGTLADFAIDHGTAPARIARDSALTQGLQLKLLDAGVPLYWFDDLGIGDPGFRAAQFLAVRGIFGSNANDLHFAPRSSLSRREAVEALARALEVRAQARSEVEAKTPQTQFAKGSFDAIVGGLIRQGYWPGSLSSPGEQNLTWSDLEPASRKSGMVIPAARGESNRPTRAEFAIWLEQVYRTVTNDIDER